jgi:hypothetical protein
MISRVAAVSAAVAIVILVASGCQPEPAPAPSPSTAAFATEAEAFAAAEETYRAYVDALNQVDLSDPETFEAVYAWTTGEANAGARKSFSEMSAEGWTVGGESTVGAVTPIDASLERPLTAAIAACLDVSDVTLVDPSGKSRVDADRPDVQEVRVDTVASEKSPTGLLISNLDGSDEGICG